MPAMDTTSLNIIESLRVAAITLAVALPVYLVTSTIYNIFLHPLRHFPGPLSRRASHIPYHLSQCLGGQPYEVHRLHEKYGPVVRIAPDNLSFVTGGQDATYDIYARKPILPKHEWFYRHKGVPRSIINENDENHAALRKRLASGFSEKSMRAQEGIIGSYVDMLLQQLRARCGGTADEGRNSEVERPAIDLKSWYNWTTFDIIGDLSFGEPFGSLERGEEDPWITALTNALKLQPYLLILKRLGLGNIVQWANKLSPSMRRLQSNTEAKIQRRLNLETSRYDLVEGLLSKKDKESIDLTKSESHLLLRQNCATLIIAGSETTATLLSGVTYLLLANPSTLTRVQHEVRSSFESETDINLLSVAKLPYMLACLNEAFRRYPPVPVGLPRTVPQEGAMIAGHAIPGRTIVSVWQWPTNHSSRNFQDPFAFKPERWLDESKNPADHLDAVQPFSMGPRNCIGKNLSIAEMRLILARIIFNFDMELAEESKTWIDQKMYNLWDKPPLYVRLTPVR